VIVERPALERRVTAVLDAGRIPVVLGGCGTGRSSLLLRLAASRTGAQYLDMAAAATTPERCLAAVLAASRFATDPAPAGLSARAAFDALLDHFDQARTADGGRATFLLDDFIDIRTFESFPGLRHVLRDVVARLAESPSHFVLASRFTTRVHRLLRDAPARFEVVHVPPLDAQEVEALALAIDGADHGWAAEVAGPVTALTDGRAAAVAELVSALASTTPASDPIAALAALFSPGGAGAARCRESYEFRLHRARGYGALKAILGILAEVEPLSLTEVAHHLHRTPGSTKDYLSWLEDVDLVTVRAKRYAFDDPLLRLYVRLYGGAAPPTDADIVREVGGYAKARLAAAPLAPVPHATAPAPAGVPAEVARTGIIEID
jgi:hypothetical protein